MTKFILSALTCLLCFCSVTSVSAQAVSYGNTYVHTNAVIGIHGELIFNNNGAGTYPGVIVTSRNSLNPGVVAFGDNGTWDNADNEMHVDGYVKVYSDESFTFPIGNLGKFQPITISGAAGTMAAYFNDNVEKLPFINNTVSARSSEDSKENLQISSEEYWDVRGDKPTKITLHWDHDSYIEQLSNNDLQTLTMVGWNGSSWEVISSSVDLDLVEVSQSVSSYTGEPSSLTIGSITTNDEIIPDDYSVITFGALTDKAIENGSTQFGSELASDETIEFTLFPNPTSNLSNINIDYDITQTKSDANLVVLNSLGEMIYNLQLNSKSAIINLAHDETTSGIYHIGIYTENGSKVFKPVIVARN